MTKAPDVPKVAFETDTFELLLLREGDRAADLDAETTKRLQGQHIQYLFGLQAAGRLRAAGAVAPRNADQPINGLGFFATGSVDEVRRLAGDDPSVRAGLDAVEVLMFVCPKGAIRFASEGAANMAASRRLIEEVFGRGNYDVADEILAVEFIGHGPGAPPAVGTESLKRQAARLRGAFPDFAVALEDSFAAGDRVCTRWSSTGTHTRELPMPAGPLAPTGKRIEFSETRIDRHENGRIAECWFLPDRFSLWQQLGLIGGPAPDR